ncbi:hypothetical protein C8R45DRAFT_551121 [Mycena sanguinolenta]|nr:hypothetical protein C8R45DRAFT_551121 [Mycena sanguinolenta]
MVRRCSAAALRFAVFLLSIRRPGCAGVIRRNTFKLTALAVSIEFCCRSTGTYYLGCTVLLVWRSQKNGSGQKLYRATRIAPKWCPDCVAVMSDMVELEDVLPLSLGVYVRGSPNITPKVLITLWNRDGTEAAASR